MIIRFRMKKKPISQLHPEFNVIIEQDEEGFFVATVPELKGCHTQAKSLDLLMRRVKEAIKACLADEKDTQKFYHFVGLQRVVV